MGQFDLRGELNQIFGAFVSQETLESAADEMAAISKDDRAQHVLFAEALTHGVEAARAGDHTICQTVEQSGYFARSVAEAEEILLDLQSLYPAKSKWP